MHEVPESLLKHIENNPNEKPRFSGTFLLNTQNEDTVMDCLRCEPVSTREMMGSSFQSASEIYAAGYLMLGPKYSGFVKLCLMHLALAPKHEAGCA